MSDKPHVRLAAELRKIGLDAMAAKADDGYYGDFTSPLAAPISTLVDDLEKAGTDEAEALARRAMNGEFDG